MKVLRFGKHMIPLWLIVVLLISGVGIGVLADQIWRTLTIPVRIEEPLEVLTYPSELSLYPGENMTFYVTVVNHASLNYSVLLNFKLSNTTYQTSYVTFSNTIYAVLPTEQNLTAWMTIKPDAPAINTTLSIDFHRGVYPYGLVGYWKFDEGSGNTASDSSGNNNTGTIYGPTWDTGKIGQALKFDGTDDYVSISPLNISGITSLTVSAWIKSPFDQIGYVLHNGYNGEFVLHNGERPFDGSVSGRYPNLASFSVKLQDASIWDVYSTPLTPNTWHCFTGVWIKGASLRIYVDGVLMGENDSIPDYYLYNPGPAYNPRIGAYPYTEPDFFEGLIDEVRIYNRALTNGEIGILYSVSPQ
jgi:hypothetical protein